LQRMTDIEKKSYKDAEVVAKKEEISVKAQER
jgi:hypothetical protein